MDGNISDDDCSSHHEGFIRSEEFRRCENEATIPRNHSCGILDSHTVNIKTRNTNYGTNGIIGETATQSSFDQNTYISQYGSDAHNLRSKLKFYFLNPLQKWKLYNRFPYKLSIQLIKIIFVTFQLVVFASYRYANVNYMWNNKVSFSHLFLKDWDKALEINAYPPAAPPYAIYLKQDFYDHIDYAITAYSSIDSLAIGPYFARNQNGSLYPISVCYEEYKSGVIFSANESYVFDGQSEDTCLEILSTQIDQKNFSFENFLSEKNASISFNSLLSVKLELTLKTIRFRNEGLYRSPDCFDFKIVIEFNNEDHDGQMLVLLNVTPVKFFCKGDVENKDYFRTNIVGRSVLNYSVILLCLLSFGLCCRAIYRSQILKQKTVIFFRKHFKSDLSVPDRLSFINFWYLMIIFNDVLIILGSVIKEIIEKDGMAGDLWNLCSLLLGVGNLLVWFGVLRYLGFFRTYNVLILTLERATPNVLRFLLCALLIYAGFTFCGWLVLGPYHIKFSTLSTTSECLYSLINGDDMFATFAGMSSKSTLLWWFSRLYLYSFISLFIYIVLSLFVALILDAYDTIKLCYAQGFPETPLQKFIRATPEALFSLNPPDYSDQLNFAGNSTGGLLDTIVETVCRCNSSIKDVPKRRHRANSNTDTEDEPLLRP